MRVVFAGTPEFAAKHLSALIENKFNVVAVYTQPDRPAGRGKKLKPSEVKTLALEHEIPVLQPPSLKSENTHTELSALQPDIMIVVAYGIILPQAVLDIPKFGCINVHGSLLPKWRGAAPIQRSIWAGDKTTGVTIMQMDAGLDTGPILHKESIVIEQQDTSASLYQKLAEVGPKALVKALNNIDNWQPEQQNDADATYASKLSKEEAKIDWNLPAEQLIRNTKAFNPWPISWFELDNNAIKVWQMDESEAAVSNTKPGQIIRADKNGLVVATGSKPVRLLQIQIPGKKPMSVVDVLNARGDWFKVGALI